MFVTCFQWRYHIILHLRKCVFRFHLNFWEGKRLFLISLFSVIFFRDPKNQHYLQLFVYVFYSQLRFINSKTFLPFVYSLFLMLPSLSFLIEHKAAACLIYKCIKQKEIPHVIIFWGHFLGIQKTVDHYHFGSGCNADMYHVIKGLKKGRYQDFLNYFDWILSWDASDVSKFLANYKCPLKVVSSTFSLACFLILKERTWGARKNGFISLQKLFAFSRKSNFRI